MSWASDAQIKKKVADLVSDDNIATTEDKWTDEITAKNTDARQEIMAIALARGYTAAQVDTWASQQAVHKDLAAWFLVQDMNVKSDSFDLTRLAYLDRRESIRDPLYIFSTAAGAAIDADPAVDLPPWQLAQDRGEDALDEGWENPQTKNIVL